MIQRALILFAVTAFCATASAQSASDSTDEPETRYAPVTEVEFGDQYLEATMAKPTGILHLEVKRGSFAPMIKLRADFNPEMSTSVDNIK